MLEHIPARDLPRMIGKWIRLSWANPRASWKLLEVLDKGSIKLEAPKSGKILFAKACDACYMPNSSPVSNAEAKTAITANGSPVEWNPEEWSPM